MVVTTEPTEGSLMSTSSARAARRSASAPSTRRPGWAADGLCAEQAVGGVAQSARVTAGGFQVLSMMASSGQYARNSRLNGPEAGAGSQLVSRFIPGLSR